MSTYAVAGRLNLGKYPKITLPHNGISIDTEIVNLLTIEGGGCFHICSVAIRGTIDHNTVCRIMR